MKNAAKSNSVKKIKGDLPPLSPANEKLGKPRLVKWIAEILRPLSIVEDKGF